jgi:hypothetical protein
VYDPRPDRISSRGVSALERITDSSQTSREVRKVRILLQKAFWGGDRNFSGPPMRFARGDMRDHIVSHQNDQGALHRRYGVLQWPRRPKINFCEIFDVVRFSTFATISARNGHGHRIFASAKSQRRSNREQQQHRMNRQRGITEAELMQTATALAQQYGPSRGEISKAQNRLILATCS